MMVRWFTRDDLRLLGRFYRYAVPYWKLVVVGFAAMLVATAMSLNGAVMFWPAYDALAASQPKAEVAAAPAPGGAAHGDAAQPGAFARARERAKAWALNLPVVRHVMGWLASGNRITRLALFLALAIAPIWFVSNTLYEYLSQRIVWHVMADLRADVFRQLSSLSLGYYSGQRTGEIVSRLTNDIQTTQVATRLIFGKAFQAPVVFLVFLLAALFTSWQLTLIAVAGAPLVAVLQGRLGVRIRRHSRKNLQKLADITEVITETLQGIRVVKSFDQEGAETRRFEEQTDQQLRRAFKLVRTRALADALPDLLLFECLAVVAIIASGLVAAGTLEVGQLIQCLVLLGFTMKPVRVGIVAYNDLQISLAGAQRIFELLDRQPDLPDAPDAVELAGVSQGVRFDDVWFSYGAEPVLTGIDLFVPRGEVCAVVGETGAGKSTMLDLIPRFYDVQRGSLTVDGVDVRRIKRHSLMSLIAIVGQHPFLFNRSVGENIRYGKPDATDEEVVAAAKAANIHDFIVSLPEGYDTSAGERGGRFSGGQRQCITIARAILKDAPILILDEATSSLDAESEMLVQTALSNLMEGRTTFVIAHRLSTVRHADRIVVLKDGRIVEQGTHAQLLELRGEYERLYRLQFSDLAARGTAGVPGVTRSGKGAEG